LSDCGSLTAPALAAWAIRLDWLRIPYPLAYLGWFASVADFERLAIVELVADKLP